MLNTKVAVAAALSAAFFASCGRDSVVRLDEDSLWVDSVFTIEADGTVSDHKVFFRDEAGHDTLMILTSCGREVGRRRSLFDSLGRVTRERVEAPDYVMETVYTLRPDGKPASFAYSGSEGRLRAVMDYDTAGRVTRQKSWFLDGVDDTLVTTRAYDAAGHEIESVDYDGDEPSSKIVRVYDAAGHEVGSRLYFWDAGAWRLTSSEENEFDDCGRQIRSVQRADDVVMLSETLYDEAGNVAAQVVSAQDSVGGSWRRLSSTEFSYAPCRKTAISYSYSDDGNRQLMNRTETFFRRKE